MSTTPQRGIEEVLHAARARLDRLDPRQASDAVDAAAVLVDIRPQRDRESDGQIPGALVIERNVLEWRLDPASDARLPIAAYDLHVVVVCNEGYTSSLAAAALHEIGVHRATDLIGGYRAWRAAGLPTTEPRLDPGRRRSRQTGSSIPSSSSGNKPTRSTHPRIDQLTAEWWLRACTDGLTLSVRMVTGWIKPFIGAGERTEPTLPAEGDVITSAQWS